MNTKDKRMERSEQIKGRKKKVEMSKGREWRWKDSGVR